MLSLKEQNIIVSFEYVFNIILNMYLKFVLHGIIQFRL